MCAEIIICVKKQDILFLLKFDHISRGRTKSGKERHNYERRLLFPSRPVSFFASVVQDMSGWPDFVQSCLWHFFMRLFQQSGQGLEKRSTLNHFRLFHALASAFFLFLLIFSTTTSKCGKILLNKIKLYIFHQTDNGELQESLEYFSARCHQWAKRSQ